LEQIKTYNQVEPGNELSSFRIKKMEEIYHERSGKSDEPHRHDYFTILLITKGKGDHKVDFKSHKLSNNQLWFISPGQVHQLIEETPTIGWAITFTRSFLYQNGIDDCFISDVNLFRDYGDTPPIDLSPDETEQLDEYCGSMFKSLRANSNFNYQEIGALLKLFLIRSYNLCSLSRESNTQVVEAGTGILREYKNLVEEHFTKEHQVNFYAKLLAVSPDHLNKTIKTLIGKTAKEYLQSRLTIAAKRMLRFTPKSVKEIGYDLGFSDPSHFSRFFKKCTNYSPAQFRNTLNN
jgi:AraC-like DNA-binding protein/mannose-6-phosphate isomerase-like protein (cupin superfamily)